MRSRKFVLIIVALMIVMTSLGVIYSQQSSRSNTQPSPASQPAGSLTPSPTDPVTGPTAEPASSTPPPQTTSPSLTEPASIWVVVNKKRPLPADYSPAPLRNSGGRQLRDDAAAQLDNLLSAAQAANIPLKVISGYRSYATQKTVYNGYVQADGQAAADTYSARPGHSEHQTGLAADLGNANGVCDLEICFFDTAGGQWLASHAYKYGFIIRYLNGKDSVTGYQYEPWHVRYVGTDLAQQLYANGKTMEEHFGLPAAANY